MNPGRRDGPGQAAEQLPQDLPYECDRKICYHYESGQPNKTGEPADEAGGIIITVSSDYRVDMMPFGGVKKSGLGREGIKFALQEMTEPRVVCFNL